MSKQKESRPNVIRAGLWYTISSVSIKAVGVITTPIFTRILSTSEYGEVATFTSWYAILSVFACLALYYSIGRAKLDFPDEFEKYVGSMQAFSELFVLAFAIISIVFLKPVSSILELRPVFTILLVIYLLAEPSNIMMQNKFKYQYNYKGNISISIYISLATILFSIGFIFFIPDKSLGRVLGIVLPPALLSVIFWLYQIRRHRLNLNFCFIKYGLAISLPMVLHTVSLNIMAQSDRLMITKYCGKEQTAIYSLAYTYAMLIDIIFNAVGQAWLPWFHDNYAINAIGIKSNVNKLIGLGCIFAIGAIGISPEAISILGPNDYHVGVYVVVPVVLGALCKYIFTNYEHVELHLKQTKYISYATIFAAGINIVLNVIFIPMYGFIAAAYTTLISYLVLMVLHHAITKIVLQQNPYDNIYLYGSLFLTMVIGYLFMLLFNHILVRYGLLCLIIIGYLVKNKDMIFKLMYRKGGKD